MQTSRGNETYRIKDELINCDDVADMKEILDKNSGIYSDWKKFINNLVRFAGSYGAFAQRCGFSRNTVKKWCDNGDMPRSRVEFIKLGFAMGMNIDELNKILQRYGKYPKLYSKNIQDAIYIFALSHQKDYLYAQSLYDKLLSYYEIKSSDTNRPQFNAIRAKTDRVHNSILTAKDETEFIHYVQDNKEIFEDTYTNLIDIIDSYIKTNVSDYTDLTYSESLNAFLQENITNRLTIKSFNVMISNLKAKREIPNRMKLISFGIYLGMSLEHMNTMLTYAGMEELCAKDRVEGAVIFAIENAIINNPDLELTNELLLSNFTNNEDLRNKCLQIIADYEQFDYKSEYSESAIIEYVVNALKAIECDETNEMMTLLKDYRYIADES